MGAGSVDWSGERGSGSVKTQAEQRCGWSLLRPTSPASFLSPTNRSRNDGHVLASSLQNVTGTTCGPTQRTGRSGEVPMDKEEWYENSHFARRHCYRLRPGRPGTGSHLSGWCFQLPQKSWFGAIIRSSVEALHALQL